MVNRALGTEWHDLCSAPARCLSPPLLRLACLPWSSRWRPRPSRSRVVRSPAVTIPRRAPAVRPIRPAARRSRARRPIRRTSLRSWKSQARTSSSSTTSIAPTARRRRRVFPCRPFARRSAFARASTSWRADRAATKSRSPRDGENAPCSPSIRSTRRRSSSSARQCSVPRERATSGERFGWRARTRARVRSPVSSRPRASSTPSAETSSTRTRSPATAPSGATLSLRRCASQPRDGAAAAYACRGTTCRSTWRSRSPPTSSIRRFRPRSPS